MGTSDDPLHASRTPRPLHRPRPRYVSPVRALARRVAAFALAAVCAACTVEERIYTIDGLARARGERSRSDGLEQGEWTWWFPNGERREAGTFEDGRRVGTWTQWYPNGQKRSRGERRYHADARASLREGEWTYWHENGVRAARGVYQNGLREGVWEYTLDNGGLNGDHSGVYRADRKLD